jgi:ankyrin repeat protein
MISIKADPLIKNNSYNYSTLHIASRNKNVKIEILQYLLDLKCSINETVEENIGK